MPLKAPFERAIEAGLLDTKQATFQVKALNAKARTFEALVATWDLDKGDDIIHQGAFKTDLAAWRKDKNRVIQLLDTHDSMSIFSAVGKLLEGQETKAGLNTLWKVIPGPDGDGALTRVEEGVVNKMSIGYKAVRWEFEESDEARFGVIRHLHEMEFHEGSLVLRPMNDHAAVDTGSVKALLEHKVLTEREVKLLERVRDRIELRLDALAGKETPGDGDDEGEEGGEPPEPEPPQGDPSEPQDDDEDVPPEGDDLEIEGAEDAPKQHPAARSPADDDAPDMNRLSSLRLRRLGYSFPTQTQEA